MKERIPAASVTAVMDSADDDEFREIARQVQDKSPGWMVLWGVYTRQFVAFPLFAAPSGTIITAAYPDALAGRLKKTSRALNDSPGGDL